MTYFTTHFNFSLKLFNFKGSGSTYIYGHCDATYKKKMTKEECYKFVANGRMNFNIKFYDFMVSFASSKLIHYFTIA